MRGSRGFVVRRALLLAALLAIYGAFAFRGAVRGIVQRGAFDPLLPFGRTVELAIGEKRFAEALPAALELQQAYPSEPLVTYWLAQIHHGLEHPAAEAEMWERYMALSSAPAEACPALPLAYGRLRRMDQAVSAFERCARLAPDDAELLIDLGKAYLDAGRREPARAAFERAAALDPDHPLLRGYPDAAGRVQ
jgi:tetratricopeptide (TPR) repeat protein